MCISVASKGISADSFRSSNPLQSYYASQIPHLKKQAEQASRKAESLKRRIEDEEAEEDEEMLEQFFEYQKRLIEEEEQRRLQERAALILAEKVEQQKVEEARRESIEQNAINKYKEEQDKIKTLALEKETQLRDGLARHGLDVDQIESIIRSPHLPASVWGSIEQNQPSPRSIAPLAGEREDTATAVDGSVHAASMAPNRTHSISSWYVDSICSIYLTAFSNAANTNCRS